MTTKPVSYVYQAKGKIDMTKNSDNAKQAYTICCDGVDCTCMGRPVPVQDDFEACEDNDITSKLKSNPTESVDSDDDLPF